MLDGKKENKGLPLTAVLIMMSLQPRSYVWEILKNTLNKVVSRASQIKSRLDSFRQLHADNEVKRAANPVTESKTM